MVRAARTGREENGAVSLVPLVAEAMSNHPAGAVHVGVWGDLAAVPYEQVAVCVAAGTEAKSPACEAEADHLAVP
tara:strand:- start:4270 stop:4494 length:225 start_codon:yes stop_codon:yes gene_type:complete